MRTAPERTRAARPTAARSRRPARILTALAVLLATTGAGLWTAAPAVAAVTAPTGVPGLGAFDPNTWVGGLSLVPSAPDGDDIVYCVTPGGDYPVVGGTNAGVTGTVPGMTTAEAAKADYLLWNYGRITWTGTATNGTALVATGTGPKRGDNALNQGAAVQFAVWQVVQPDTWMRNHFGGSTAYDGDPVGAIRHWLSQGGMGAARQDNVVAMYRTLLAAVVGVVPGADASSTVTTSTRLADAVIAAAGADGAFAVTMPGGIPAEGATGTLALANATWDATGTATLTRGITPIHAGEVFRITADAPAASPGRYGISLDGELVRTTTTTSTTTGYPGAVRYFTSADAGRQTVARGIGPTTFTSTRTTVDRFALGGGAEVDLRFAPKVVTEVARAVVAAGEPLADRITPATGAAPWPVDPTTGLRVPVVFRAAIHRTDRPLRDGEALPADAVLVGTATRTLGGTREDPTGRTVTVDGPAASAAGYYLWTWAALPADQDASRTLPFLEPAALPWTDPARVRETSSTPMTVAIGTRLVDTALGAGRATTDLVTIAPADGVWLRTPTGAPETVTATGTVTWSATAPTRQPTAPSDAIVLGAVEVTTTGPDAVESPAIVAPEEPGWLVVQWCAEGPAVVPVCDDWGVPEETAEVRGLTVTTEAPAEAGPGTALQDVATVDGLLPASPVTIEFAAYAASGGEDDDAGSCTAERLAFRDAPQPVEATGEYRSAAFVPEAPGRYVWQATVRAGERVVAQDDCGEPGELTVVAAPAVPAQAPPAPPAVAAPPATVAPVVTPAPAAPAAAPEPAAPVDVPLAITGTSPRPAIALAVALGGAGLACGLLVLARRRGRRA